MAGAPVCSGSSRVRIKGHTASVLRFFFIAVSFMMCWVLITSELGYYSKWFGPQILLQLNIAFYLPSIPLLIISGQVEKVLDAKFGPTMSMMIRLVIGLAGCTAISAAFPFIPPSHTALMVFVAILGTLSALAFSTAYQLVQWFRHADIIALGIGGVGSGPIVLFLQIFLDVGSQPHRWQWIAMFSVTAAVSLIGLLSALSLFAQYWKIMSGEEQYSDGREPLLLTPAEQKENTMCLMSAPNSGPILLTPDPFHGLPLILSPEDFHWDEDGPPRLHRANSTGVLDAHARKSRQQTKLWNKTQSAHVTNSWRPATSSPGAAVVHQDRSSHYPSRGSGSSLVSTPPRMPPSSPSPLDKSNGVHGSQGNMIDEESAHSITTSSTTISVFQGSSHQQLAAEAIEAAEGAHMTLREEISAVATQIWPVLMAFLASVTVLYLVFPFFTYVQSSGLLGDTLPKVLFFTRIFSDIIGRFIPRRKSLMVRSPGVLLTLATAKVVVATLFFLYIKSPARVHHDILPLLIVLFLWVLGGYINTSANILAPGLVSANLVGRASALMALTFQIAHFAGLILAVMLAWVLYGDIVG